MSNVVLTAKDVVVGATVVLEEPPFGAIGVLTIADAAPKITVVGATDGVDEPINVVGTEVLTVGVPIPETVAPAVAEAAAPESTVKRTSSTGIGIPNLVGFATTVTPMRNVFVVLPARPVTSIDVRPRASPPNSLE